ncbi:MAG: peptidoglycan-binding protein [Cyanobacteria bacterium SID2]|nr:peptidoglycan-binding protein [Cyanobacteria bacterium SID2]MBP0005719.1 peptidoglycan-binding protein [Cyanobacteria bacterium SBC]
MSRGIDVSDYQGSVNWIAVANSGISFAVTKATEGATFVADSFSRNWSGIKAAGLVRGAYHFFRPRSNALAQADRFLDIVKLETGDLPPVLDIETDDGVDAASLAARMQTWLDRVEQVTQRRPIIYTYPGFWERLGNWQQFSDYPLWIAHYTTASSPWVPGGWRTWTLWQYTDTGSVNGVPGGVDVNGFNTAKEGTTNALVIDVQKRLKHKGFDPGSIDGTFKTKTKAATIAFQTAVGIFADGIVGPQTWAYLADNTPFVNPPIPKPPTPPDPPMPQLPIQLIDVMKHYQGLSHQIDALQWLQLHTPDDTLREFARRWRNQLTTTTSIEFVDVARYYQNLASQNQALTWLQGQLSDAFLEEFAQKWRTLSSAEPPAIVLNKAAKYYEGLFHQDRAWDWLQRQLTREELSEFARLWRNP